MSTSRLLADSGLVLALLNPDGRCRLSGAARLLPTGDHMAFSNPANAASEPVSKNAHGIADSVEVATEEFRSKAFHATTATLNNAVQLDVQQASQYELLRQTTCAPVPTWVHPDMLVFE